MLGNSLLGSALGLISQNTILAVTATGVLLITWRLWRFTLAPILWPAEPKPLPYWIPILGHTWAFMSNAEKLFNKGYVYFGNSEPFALTVGGRTTVVIRDVQDVAAVWKYTTALSFDPFIHGVMKSFGISPKSVQKIFADPRTLVKEEARPKSLLIKENPSQKSYIHLQSDWFKEQLLPRERLNKLIDIYHGHLDKALSWKDLPSAYVLSSKACLDIKTISLQAFCRYTVSHCSINTFFGEKLLLVAPSFARDYQKYEDDSWKIFYHFPHILAKDLHKAKKSAIDGLVKFLSLPEEQRADLAWIFQTMNRELQYLTLDSCDIAGIIMLIAWAINNNAHKLCFWIFAHALCNPPLLASLRAETDKACSPDGSVDIDTLISECPQLDAVWWEALRVYNAASVVRKAEADCMVGGKIIHSGDTVLGPFRQFHLNTGIFGENACAFDSGRFLKNRNLQRTRGYAPFGGGHTYCPGRLFAQREVYLLIAMTLYRFDLALEPQQGTGGLRVPAVDIDRPSAAAMGPATDLLVGVKPRAVEAKA